MKRAVLFIVIGIVSILAWRWYAPVAHAPKPITLLNTSSPSVTVAPTISPTPIPQSVTIPTSYHVFETFNNCGPASLSMALSYFGINKSQQELGLALRPYQNPKGDNDDKSVTLDELAKKAMEFNLDAVHRPNGNIETIKQFIAAGIPVITRTRLKKEDDIGHYRIIKGYDDTTQEFIQDDSYQGKNLRFSYTDFSDLWQTFGNEYLVIVPQEKLTQVKSILGVQWEESFAWHGAVKNAMNSLALQPEDMYTRLNLSVALYHTGDYKGSVSEFEKVENKLPFRTLWYQIEPILSYYEIGNYTRVFEITDKIFTNQNRAFSELYILRGRIYQKQGDKQKAKEEFEKAVFYNASLKEAREALASVK